MSRLARTLALLAALWAAWEGSRCSAAQEVEVERPEPPALDDFESDKNRDGVPDGWYNARDVTLESEGGKVRPHYLKFETRKPGRPSRLSRAFGVDGRKTEAIVIGLWVSLDQVQAGERLGEDPGLIVDFLGDGLRALRRGTVGPWSKTVGNHWTRVAKRIAVPPGTRDAIMSVGLLGATGILRVDGLTIDLIPVDGSETTNMVVNGDFELGDPNLTGWSVEGGARRSSPGDDSDSALELAKSGARALAGLGVPVEPFGELLVRARVRALGLRGAGGAAASVFFLDDDGEILPGAGSAVRAFSWAGSFEWRDDRAVVAVPQGAVRAVLQFEKADGIGQVRIDNVSVSARPNAAAGAWIPYHVEDDTTGWSVVRPSPAIEAKSALDASSLLDAPAGTHGFVTVRDGRLAFTKGGRARFFGVVLLPPMAFIEAAQADALAERLARSGVNLARLGDLDTPLGPDRSLFDDSRDDTKAFDPIALAKLDHLIAAFKRRGIYVALELQSVRRFRSEDGVGSEGGLPPGGGPAAEFDPVISKLARESARALLEHVNPETGLALRDDPVLAWVTLAGEVSLFDLIDNPGALPQAQAEALHALAARSNAGGGRRFWQVTGAAHWKELAGSLRDDNLKVPVAGVSHWRREPEFGSTQASAGLDLIDDRLYWMPPPWISPGKRSLLWSLDGGLIAGAARKRKGDRPYVVGQWCHQTMGAWALPFEAADLMLASETAASEDWDALVRRGLFVHPRIWGANAAGTGGGEDLFQVPEVVNGIPQVYALWPHAASIVLRKAKTSAEQPTHPAGHKTGSRHRATSVAGWEPNRGRLVIDTPYTQGIAGWSGGEAAVFNELTIEVQSPYAVVVASSVGPKPIATTSRLLVSAVARVQPKGFRWVDEWRRDVAEPGRPPLLQEPVQARVLIYRKGDFKAFALDNSGARIASATLDRVQDGFQLTIDPAVMADGLGGITHWEIVQE